MMKPILLYIHGLGSDQNSRKFLNLKSFFQNQFDYDFIEWKNDDDVSFFIQEKMTQYRNIEQLVIIGDSTGANFAYQLREKRAQKKDVLILTSPLLDINKRIAEFDFPEQLITHLIRIKKLENMLILVSRKDEILDQKGLFKDEASLDYLLEADVEVVEINDSHRLLDFDKIGIPVIEKYLTRIIKEQ